MNTTRHEQMWNSLRDPEFRKQLIDEHINVGIAFQIRGLRNRQKLRQKDLAEQLSVKQPLVSAWENPNYGNYSLNTLKDMAKAFDVGLLVRFVPFSTLVNWTLNVTPNIIAPPSFGEERYHGLTSVSATSNLVEDASIINANNPSLISPYHPDMLNTANTKKELISVA
jgi:transcriptional regulator with XRE-family HTH domain